MAVWNTHQRSTVHIVLSKNECKGAAAARKVAQLAKALAGVLPQTRLKDLIFQTGDPRLEDVKKIS